MEFEDQFQTSRRPAAKKDQCGCLPPAPGWGRQGKSTKDSPQNISKKKKKKKKKKKSPVMVIDAVGCQSAPPPPPTWLMTRLGISMQIFLKCDPTPSGKSKIQCIQFQSLSIMIQ